MVFKRKSVLAHDRPEGVTRELPVYLKVLFSAETGYGKHIALFARLISKLMRHPLVFAGQLR